MQEIKLSVARQYQMQEKQDRKGVFEKRMQEAFQYLKKTKGSKAYRVFIK